ncbi:MAG: CBS domain-containing protein [Candidatus Thermoplasmatota archaeon]|jgi:predicted transcriptional regulator|nr:CBS domain-containing protein [Candidatus Thermoplasmatota archaeon]
MLPSIPEIRKMRKNLGISQKELAGLTGVSQSYIARLEKGEINPTYEKIRKIYEILNQNGSRANNLDLTVSKIMSPMVITAISSDTVVHALTIMREKGYSQLPVLEQRRVVGTITEADINDLLVKGKSIESLKNMIVKDIMGPALPQVDKSSPVSMIYPILKFSNAVLIFSAGELKGIVTKADVLKAVDLYG